MSVVTIMLLNGGTPDHVGIIPTFFDLDNPDPAVQQIDDNYQHGGGWRPMKKDAWKRNEENEELTYPGEPPLEPRAAIIVHDDVVYVYDFGFVSIVHPDGSFEVARVD